MRVEKGYLNGYRNWRITTNRLAAINFQTPFPKGAVPAQCHRGDYGGFLFNKPRSDHDSVPDKDCRCGYYALWDPEPMSLEFPTVLGKVKGWGRAFTASLGWRSEYQIIEELYYPFCTVCYGLTFLIPENQKIDAAVAHLNISLDLTYLDEKDGPDSFKGLDFIVPVCKYHQEGIKKKRDKFLLAAAILGPEDAQIDRLTIDKFTVHRDDDEAILRNLKAISNYYEVDIKEFNYVKDS